LERRKEKLVDDILDTPIDFSKNLKTSNEDCKLPEFCEKGVQILAFPKLNHDRSACLGLIALEICDPAINRSALQSRLFR